MKKIFVLLLAFATITLSFAQAKKANAIEQKFVVSVNNLTLEAAFELQKQATGLAAE